jgi:hypothetical protein
MPFRANHLLFRAGLSSFMRYLKNERVTLEGNNGMLEYWNIGILEYWKKALLGGTSVCSSKARRPAYATATAWQARAQISQKTITQ